MVPAMQVPDDLPVQTDHEWARLADGKVQVGITDYAQDALGDVVFVDLPAVGARVEVGGVLGEVESTKSVSEIYAPVAGEVVAVNTRAGRHPELLNTDPYGAGWISEIAPPTPDALDALLDATRYTRADLRVARRRAGSGDGTSVDGVFCNNCGHRNPADANFCSSCGAVLDAGSSDTDGDLHPVDAQGEAGDEELSVTLPDRPSGTGLLVVKRGPNAGTRFDLVDRGDAGRAPSRERHLPRRHHRVAPPRRVHQGHGGLHRARRGLAQRHLREPRAHRRGGARPRATRCRSGSSSSSTSPRPTMSLPRAPARERSDVPVDRRRARSAAPGVPRRHDLEDPLPREPGARRPRAHPVGVPQVLRARRRAAALGAAPTARALPAAQGDQGSPRAGRVRRRRWRRRRAARGAVRRPPRAGPGDARCDGGGGAGGRRGGGRGAAGSQRRGGAPGARAHGPRRSPARRPGVGARSRASAADPGRGPTGPGAGPETRDGSPPAPGRAAGRSRPGGARPGRVAAGPAATASTRRLRPAARLGAVRTGPAGGTPTRGPAGSTPVRQPTPPPDTATMETLSGDAKTAEELAAASRSRRRRGGATRVLRAPLRPHGGRRGVLRRGRPHVARVGGGVARATGSRRGTSGCTSTPRNAKPGFIEQIVLPAAQAAQPRGAPARPRDRGGVDPARPGTARGAPAQRPCAISSAG